MGPCFKESHGADSAVLKIGIELAIQDADGNRSLELAKLVLDKWDEAPTQG